MKLFFSFIFFVLYAFSFAGNATADFKKTNIAILPFNLQGDALETDNMGTIVSEWLLTAFVQDGRFKVIERKLLGEVFEEQKMVETGIVSREVATEIGKILGVEVIVSGSIIKYRGVVEVNARIVDVGSASIASAKNVRSASRGTLQEKVFELASLIINDFPLKGYIASRRDNRVVLSLGKVAGVKPGMFFRVYKDGEIIRHPKTNEVLSVQQIQSGIVEIAHVQQQISEGSIVEEISPGAIKYGDYAFQISKDSTEKLLSESTPQQKSLSATRQETTADAYEHHAGSFKKDGDVWVENFDFYKGSHFFFKEMRTDNNYIYLYDETRHNSSGAMLYLRIPIRGGVSQLSWEDSTKWSDLYVVKPASGLKKKASSGSLLSDKYAHSNGVFSKEGDIWVEHFEDNKKIQYFFKEFHRDNESIYLYDQKRRNEAGGVFYLRIPAAGGVSQWAWSNLIRWNNLYLVKPM